MMNTKAAAALSMLFVCSATVLADVVSFRSGANQFNVGWSSCYCGSAFRVVPGRRFFDVDHTRYPIDDQDFVHSTCELRTKVTDQLKARGEMTR